MTGYRRLIAALCLLFSQPIWAQQTPVDARSAAELFCKTTRELDVAECTDRLLRLGRSSDKEWLEHHLNARFAAKIDATCASPRREEWSNCTEQLLTGLPPGISDDIRVRLGQFQAERDADASRQEAHERVLKQAQEQEERKAAANEAERQALAKLCKSKGLTLGTVKIGMSADQVRQCGWGKPDEVNRTITRYGVHEQWVYGSGNYLYFENGRLDAIQD